MEYETIGWRVDDGLLWLTLDRPDKMNAFTVQMADELEQAFDRASLDDEIRVIVVTGAGRAFCAGMDLSVGGNVFGLDESLRPTLADLQERFDEEEIRRGVRDTGGRVTLAIARCRKPVVAAINGVAVGIGATMTLAMDFRLASEAARIGFVFGRIGITPEACSTWFLPRLVGLQQALEWIYTADIIAPADALAAGLVRSVHAPDRLLADAEAFARKLVEGRSPVATALARQMLYRNSASDHPVEAHRIDSLAMFYTSLGDGKEGVAAFLEKRPAHFEGRASRMPAFFDSWMEPQG
ncbi:MAG: crotonase/enoyl-CoA hydratase family protein [Alphaproteobacteria bacterium]|nr:crotonase/enoyl-CoA hydratase family protein [Alphaproteobacteria bacterium]